MDFNATIDLIIKDLNDAREIIDDLKKYPGIPALQIEYAKSKCKSAAEVIALIKTIKDEVPQPHPQPQPQPKPQPQPVIPVHLIEEKATPVIEEKVIVQPKEKKKEEPKKISKKEPESQIIADRFTDISDSFNDKLASLKPKSDVPVFKKTKQISSLSNAIGLNDRFLFIREIFNGDKEAFNKAITHLDGVKSVNDARAVIMSYTGNSNENEAVTILLDLIEHKLSSNE